MDYLLKKEEIDIKEGIKLKLINTNKYKDLNIYFSFINDFNEKDNASLMIVKDLVGLVSKNYPSKKDMIKKKNLLYAASVDGNSSFLSYHQCYTLHYNFVDDKYLDDISIKEYIEFIKETLFNLEITQDILNESKKLLKDAIFRKLDKPSLYAKNRVNQLMAKQDDRFKSFDADISKTVEELTLEDLLHAYNTLLNNSLIEIVVIGDVNNELITGIKDLPFSPRRLVLSDFSEVLLKDDKLITETKKINQTSLIIVYKMNESNIYDGKKYHSWLVASGILGLLPCSLLFQEVREKLSLCYTIGVSDVKKDGIIDVHTLISEENIDKVIKQIELQLQRVINMDYSDEVFETCKVLLANSFIQGLDDSESVFNYYHSRDFFTNESFDDFISGIYAVTKQDVSNIYKDYKHVLTYVLKGEDGKTV